MELCPSPSNSGKMPYSPSQRVRAWAGGVPWADPLWFTFSFSMCLAQSHMSLGDRGPQKPGMHSARSTLKRHLGLSPKLNPKSFLGTRSGTCPTMTQ